MRGSPSCFTEAENNLDSVCFVFGVTRSCPDVGLTEICVVASRRQPSYKMLCNSWKPRQTLDQLFQAWRKIDLHTYNRMASDFLKLLNDCCFRNYKLKCSDSSESHKNNMDGISKSEGKGPKTPLFRVSLCQAFMLSQFNSWLLIEQQKISQKDDL